MSIIIMRKENVLCVRNMGKVALTGKTMVGCQDEMRLIELFL